MRFTTFASMFLGATAALAFPFQDKRADEACCCCDPNREVIVCKTTCDVCAEVECPIGAPTIWEKAPVATAAPARREEEEVEEEEQADLKECCCCDISVPEVVCKHQEECDFCNAVECPPTAPTVWPFEPPAPAPTPDPFECCCCNPSLGAYVCHHQDPMDCFCPAVECPPDAPSITIPPVSAPTA